MKKLKIRDQNITTEKVSLKERMVVSENFTFNFSFITNDKNYDIAHRESKVKVKLVERLVALSDVDKNAIMARPKEQGIEILSERDVNVTPHTDFINSDRASKAQNGYYIFRLSKLGRVIGKVIENIFYIMEIDTKFDRYNH